MSHSYPIKPLIICLLAIACIVALPGCDPFKSLSPEAQFLLKQKKGMFRGLHLDMTAAEVKAVEDLPMKEALPGGLKYQKVLQADTSELLTAEYFFNSDDHMDYVIVNYEIKSPALASTVKEDVIQFYEKKYGPSQQDENGWYLWEFQDEKGLPGLVEIALSGQTEMGETGISLELVKYYDFEAD